MRTLRAVVGVVLLMALSGCLTEGASCQGGGVCEDGLAALMCEDGVLVRYPCVGPLGCATNSSSRSIFCDFRGSSTGAPCPKIAAEQKLGFCSDTAMFMTCKDLPDGRYWKGQSCSSCTQNGLAATCAP